VEGNPAGCDLNELADRGNIAAISRAVNGGENGLDQRISLFNHAMEVLA
jgi:predicted chitinase